MFQINSFAGTKKKRAFRHWSNVTDTHASKDGTVAGHFLSASLTWIRA